jgi:hypothetical protein
MTAKDYDVWKDEAKDPPSLVLLPVNNGNQMFLNLYYKRYDGYRCTEQHIAPNPEFGKCAPDSHPIVRPESYLFRFMRLFCHVTSTRTRQ